MFEQGLMVEFFGSMKGAAASLCVGACASWLLAACGPDFDALFAGADVPSSDAGDVGASIDSSDDEGGAVDAAGCPSPPPCSGKNCSYECAPACTCSNPTCPAGNGDGVCDAVCQPGSRCDVACNADCGFTAHAATATFTCGSDAFRCGATCDQGGTCDLTCNADVPCKFSCGAGTPCIAHCPKAAGCKLECPSGTHESCGDGVQVCNRGCP